MDSNFPTANPDWPPVVVAGGFVTGVVLMRNLHRRGLQVYCIDSDPAQPAFRTVYGKAFRCPDPDEQPLEWLGFMTSLRMRMGGDPAIRPVVIASSDRFVTALADNAEALSPYFIFCRSAAATQALLATKKRQYEIAELHGLPISKTAFVQSQDDVVRFGALARFPCLIKPLHFREWKSLPKNHPLFQQKLVLAATPEELLSNYRMVSAINPEVVVQEVIAGPDENKLVYLSCYNQASERIGWCMVRQIRTDPVYFGSASVVEPVNDPEAAMLCDNFLRSFGYVGICEIELKRDSRDGAVKMIEANPRYSVTADAAPYDGVDIGWLHYLDLIGQQVSPVEPEVREFRHICLFRDIPAIRGYRKEGLLSVRDLLRSYRPPVFFFDFDLRDWRNAMGTLILVAKQIVGPTVRRFFPKKAATRVG
jgi:D-aspartate ligase